MDPKAILIKMVIDMLIRMASPELIKETADKLIDFLKIRIKESENKVDDNLLPLLEALEKAFGLNPD